MFVCFLSFVVLLLLLLLKRYLSICVHDVGAGLVSLFVCVQGDGVGHVSLLVFQDDGAGLVSLFVFRMTVLALFLSLCSG